MSAGPRLDPDRLIAAAGQRTGLSDWGDPGFRVGLEHLVDALEREARLSELGRYATEETLIGRLANRLQIIDYRTHRPAVAVQTIRRPLFVLGLPRTGTTILHEVLAQDPDHISPLHWQLMKPVPPPHADTLDSDPRIAEVEAQLAAFDQIAPTFKTIHEMGARLPTECLSILAMHFKSDEWGASYFVPGYRRWCLEQDFRDAYRWHHQVLQHLQVDCTRPRWVLKSPLHLPYLDAILGEYPDAAIVWTHREPMSVMASGSSLAQTLRGAFNEGIDPRVTAQAEVDHLSQALLRGMAWRDAKPGRDRLFVDLGFAGIMRDMIGSVEKIYDHFGFTLSDATRRRMEDYIRNRPRDKHGVHSYSTEQFGLSEQRHGGVFAPYRQRFAGFLADAGAD